MLPAWATVVLAIGGALIGALAGIAGSYLAYRSAKPNLRHQEREAWRAQLIGAIQATADAWEEYGHFLAHLVLLAPEEDRAPDQAALEKSGNLTTLLGQPLTRVMLLYGRHSPTGVAADKFSKTLADLEAMLPDRWNPTQVGLVLTEADETFDEVMERAHTAIKPPGWDQ